MSKFVELLELLTAFDVLGFMRREFLHNKFSLLELRAIFHHRFSKIVPKFLIICSEHGYFLSYVTSH